MLLSLLRKTCFTNASDTGAIMILSYFATSFLLVDDEVVVAALCRARNLFCVANFSEWLLRKETARNSFEKVILDSECTPL